MTSKNRIYIVMFFAICSLMSCILCVAQEKNNETNFNIAVNKMQTSFIMPRGYTSIPVKQSFECGDGKSTNAITYNIANRDSSVVIAFSFIALPDSLSLRRIRMFTPGWDPNKNYLKTAKSNADTLNRKLLFYDKEYSKKLFNADDAGEYIRACRLAYRNRYKNYRVIFLFKKDIGHVEITYFCTDEAGNKIEDFIKETNGMLKYDD